jgi:hypothetical protein
MAVVLGTAYRFGMNFLVASEGVMISPSISIRPV